jgi:hypothetical protein
VDTARTGIFDVSPMTMAAGLAVLVLAGSFVWEMSAKNDTIVTGNDTTSAQQAAQNAATEDYLQNLSTTISGTATSSDISPLGAAIVSRAILAYDGATKDGASAQAGIDAVQKLGASIDPGVTFTTYSTTDVKTNADSSKDRVLAYRADLRVALEPLLENKYFELDLFAQYVETKDLKYLNDLLAASANYRRAITNTLAVTVPSDAASYHAAILTSMSQFAATLEALVENASDPFASTALLKSYTVAQDNMVVSFNAIGAYAARKVL